MLKVGFAKPSVNIVQSRLFQLNQALLKVYIERLFFAGVFLNLDLQSVKKQSPAVKMGSDFSDRSQLKSQASF